MGPKINDYFSVGKKELFMNAKKLLIEMALSKNLYGFEYLGVGEKLV